MAKKKNLAGDGAAPKEPKLLVLEELGLDDLVNADKAKRAVLAANGREKPQTAEGALAARFKAEGLEGAELVRAIYVGLAGLVDAKKAAVNRANERKMAAEKRSK